MNRIEKEMKEMVQEKKEKNGEKREITEEAMKARRE